MKTIKLFLSAANYRKLAMVSGAGTSLKKISEEIFHNEKFINCELTYSENDLDKLIIGILNSTAARHLVS